MENAQAKQTNELDIIIVVTLEGGKLEMANTLLKYRYRDGANYKIDLFAVLRGTSTGKPLEKLTKEFEDKGFYPAALGLPADTFVTLGYAKYDNDPDYHEFRYVEKTDMEPTTDLTVDEFVVYMRKHKVRI